MPKPIKQTKRATDVNQLARFLVNASTQTEPEALTLPTKAQVSMLMAEMGRKGGKIGGKRRLKTMTAEQRRKIARKAARIRWSKKHKS